MIALCKPGAVHGGCWGRILIVPHNLQHETVANQAAMRRHQIQLERDYGILRPSLDVIKAYRDKHGKAEYYLVWLAGRWAHDEEAAAVDTARSQLRAYWNQIRQSYEQGTLPLPTAEFLSGDMVSVHTILNAASTPFNARKESCLAVTRLSSIAIAQNKIHYQQTPSACMQLKQAVEFRNLVEPVDCANWYYKEIDREKRASGLLRACSASP